MQETQRRWFNPSVGKIPWRLTYMPDNEYATANQAKLDTIGYYPKYVDFTGITLTSNLDGSVFRGARYENGRVAGIITKPEHSECDHDHGTCSHSQDAEHTRPININLFTNWVSPCRWKYSFFHHSRGK